MSTWFAVDESWIHDHHRRRRRASWVVAGLLLLLALSGGIAGVVANGPGKATPGKSAANCGGGSQQFGGYVIRRTTTEMAARWTVPKIEQQLQYAGASTWIGVQASTQSFVQVGTTENENSALPTYQVFWSDPQVGFLAQDLLGVSAGDVVTATMQQDSSGWALRVTDTTAGTSTSHRVDYAGTVQFNQAEWFQEDPGSACLGNIRYPKTSTVTFSNLEDDNTAPDLTYADGEIMLAADGQILVPSQFHDDGFTLQTPTGLQARYLGLATSYDVAIARLEPYFYATGPDAGKTPPSTVVQPVVTALRQSVTALDAPTWPSTLQAKMQALGTLNKRLAEDLAESTVHQAVIAFNGTSDETAPLANAIRYALGLPPTSPASLSKPVGWS